jgi:hypothetical protein
LTMKSDFSHCLRAPVMAALACLPAIVVAQSIVPPARTTTVTSSVNAASGEAYKGPPSSFASALSAGAPLIQRGPVAVRPHVTVRTLYGDGIEAGPGNPRETYIHSVAPGVLLELGTAWRLDYTPTWTFYSNEAFRDTFDQTVTLAGHVPYRHGMVGAAQSYESSHVMLVETARQTHQEKYATVVDGTYKLGRHTTFEATVSRNTRKTNVLVDAPEWTTSDVLQWASTNWVRYEISSRLECALGFSAGYDDVDIGADMTFVVPQVKVAWRPSDKITLTAQVGEESRKFDTGNRPRLKSPVYTAAAGYQLRPTTRFSADVTRSVWASYFANEVTKNQGWRSGLEQRLLEKLYVELSLSKQRTKYLTTRLAADERRSDEYRALNCRVTTVVLHRVSVAALYQAGRNRSNEAAYAFSSHQYGLEISLRF